MLAPVAELSELVGFRRVTAPDADRLGAYRWLDDEGNFDPETVGRALALPTPDAEA